MSPHHNVIHPDQMNPRSTKDSYDVADEGDDIETDISYRSKLFVGGVPRFLAIGRVYPGGSTMHTVPMSDDLVRVVVEEIRDATTPIPVVGDALRTFISWPK